MNMETIWRERAGFLILIRLLCKGNLGAALLARKQDRTKTVARRADWKVGRGTTRLVRTLAGWTRRLGGKSCQSWEAHPGDQSLSGCAFRGRENRDVHARWAGPLGRSQFCLQSCVGRRAAVGWSKVSAGKQRVRGGKGKRGGYDRRKWEIGNDGKEREGESLRGSG